MNNVENEYGFWLNLNFSNVNLINVLPFGDRILPIDRYHSPFFIKKYITVTFIHDNSKSWFYNFKNIKYVILNNVLVIFN